VLLQKLDQFRNLPNVRLAVELHALGYNQGDPAKCVKLLRQSGATLRLLDGLPASDIDPSRGAQVFARWNP